MGSWQPKTEDERLRNIVGLSLATYTRFGDTPEVARSKIMATLGGLFDGSFRRKNHVTEIEIDGVMEPMVSPEGMFLLVAGEHNINLFAPAAQARWSLIVREELDRLLACEHAWGTDGQHSTEYCKKCFVSKPDDSVRRIVRGGRLMRDESG